MATCKRLWIPAWGLACACTKSAPESGPHEQDAAPAEVHAAPAGEVAHEGSAPVVQPSGPPTAECTLSAVGHILDAPRTPGLVWTVANPPSAEVFVELASGRRASAPQGTCLRSDGGWDIDITTDDIVGEGLVSVAYQGVPGAVRAWQMLHDENSEWIAADQYLLWYPSTGCCEEKQIIVLGRDRRWHIDDDAVGWVGFATLGPKAPTAIASATERLFLVRLDTGLALQTRGREPRYASDGSLFARDTLGAVLEIKPDGYVLEVVPPLHEEVSAAESLEPTGVPAEVSADASTITAVHPDGPVVVKRTPIRSGNDRVLSLIDGPLRTLWDAAFASDANEEAATQQLGAVAASFSISAAQARYALGAEGNVAVREGRLADSYANLLRTAMLREKSASFDDIVAAAWIRALDPLGKRSNPPTQPLVTLLEARKEGQHADTKCQIDALLAWRDPARPFAMPVPNATLPCWAAAAMVLRRRADPRAAEALAKVIETASVLSADDEDDGANVDRAWALLACAAHALRDKTTEDLARGLLVRRRPSGWEDAEQTTWAILALTRWLAAKPPKAAVERAYEDAIAAHWRRAGVQLNAENGMFPIEHEP